MPASLLQRICRVGFTLYTIFLFFFTLIPFRFRVPELHHFPWPIGPSRFEWFDLTANIFLFIPFGFLLQGLTITCGGLLTSQCPHTPRSDGQSPLLASPTIRCGGINHRIVGRAILFGGTVSLVIETLQIIIPARVPSFTDLFANTLGASLGAFMGILSEKNNLLVYFLRHRQRVITASLLLYAAFLFSLPFISLEPISTWSERGKITIGNNRDQEFGWKGELISAAIYDKSLSDIEMKQHFLKGQTTSTGNPILLYQFNQRGESLLQDQSSLLPSLPLQFTGDPQDVLGAGTSPAERGLHFTGGAFLISKEIGAKLYDRIHASRRFSVEVWFYPARQFDHGGRIISLTTSFRDLFYLHQDRDEISFIVTGHPLRKGSIYWEGSEAIFSESYRPVHIVGVYDSGALLLYFNGKKVAEGNMRNGFFILSRKLNFDRLTVAKRSLLGILLFSPLGLLLAATAKNRPSRHKVFRVCLGLLFVGFILFLQARQTPPFFGPISLCIAPAAFIVGFILGEKVGTRGRTRH